MDNSTIGEDVGNNSGPQPNERQQTKIIAAFTSGDFAVFGHENVQVDADARNHFIDELALGRWDRDTQKAALETIVSPVDIDEQKGTNIVFDTISENPGLVSIAVNLLSGPDGKAVTFTQYTPRSLIDQFPTPLDVEKYKLNYLNDADKSGRGDQARELFDQFESTVYGKRLEYAEQMKLLDHEAARVKYTRRSGEAARELVMLDSVYQIPPDEAALAAAETAAEEKQPADEPEEEPKEQLSPEAIETRRTEIAKDMAYHQDQIRVEQKSIDSMYEAWWANKAGVDYGNQIKQAGERQQPHYDALKKLQAELDSLDQS